MRRANPNAGYTLIEVAVTMGIFAILVAAGVPAMRTWISNTRVRAVTDALQNGLRQAQAESLRASRQVVFVLTNSTTPQTIPLATTTAGKYWAAYTLPSMIDGSELPTLIASGVLNSSGSANITVAGDAAAVCFNSVGRLINNSTTVTQVTGAVTCTTPALTPPIDHFKVSSTGSDRPLWVEVSLGGQVHMCDPAFVISDTNPEGCQ